MWKKRDKMMNNSLLIVGRIVDKPMETRPSFASYHFVPGAIHSFIREDGSLPDAWIRRRQFTA
jgi:hypothetical protein